MTFKQWSELNPEAKKELCPDFGFRNWDSLSENEKYIIWKHLESYFFDKDPYQKKHDRYTTLKPYNRTINKPVYSSDYKFFGIYDHLKKERVVYAISSLNSLFKARVYAKTYLDNPSLSSACKDFYDIFIQQSENVVFELLSLYCKKLISESSSNKISKKENETIEEYQRKLENYRWQNFDLFSRDINEIFTAFGINLFLTRQGFVPRQDSKITEEVYKPVLSYLSSSKWEEVNTLLSDSFIDYRKNTPQGYSNSITNTISAIQAFLQLLVHNKTGKDDISKLIPEAQKKYLIPTDFFTIKIFNNLQSILAKYRQEKSTAHPKKEYANEKNARLILNLAMVFFQHCILK